MTYDRLVDWVISQLRKGWTVEEIAGRVGIEFDDDPRMRVCHERLYAWIYSPAQQHRGSTGSTDSSLKDRGEVSPPKANEVLPMS